MYFDSFIILIDITNFYLFLFLFDLCKIKFLFVSKTAQKLILKSCSYRNLKLIQIFIKFDKIKKIV